MSLNMLFSLFLYAIVKGEYYSSIGQMKMLIAEEQRIVQSYNEEVREILNNLRLNLKEVSVQNPLSAFQILKRFIKYWIPFMKNNESHGIWSTVNQDDVYGSIDAIFRLQDVYNLKVNDLVRGKISNNQFNIQLSIDDCFEIAKRAFTNQRFFYFKEWTMVSYNSTNSTEFCSNTETLTVEQMFEYIAWANYLFQNHQFVKVLTTELYEINSYNKIVDDYYNFYKDKFLDTDLKDKRYKDTIQEVYKTQNTINSRHSKNCRDEIVKKHDNNETLLCWLRYDGSLIEKLIPTKIEQINYNPDVYMFRSVLNDYQINKIKEISISSLNRATIVNPQTQVQEPAPYRVSKSTWLTESLDPVVAEINSISEQLTGLTIETAELLQIANYGLGGQYDYHFDHGNENSKMHKFDNGNRVATLLYYLTDVEYGGATVFEKDGLFLQPTKGDAVFWHNLYRNGSGCWLTKHASCPVAIGDKWVANKWFHVQGNEFRLPCSLNQYE